MPSHPYTHTDLLIVNALRYIAGEMDGDEAATFEDRLGSDQEAREAVAEAVALAGALARVPASPSVLPFRRTFTWVGAAAAAACLALLALPSVRSSLSRGPVATRPQGSVADRGSEAVALAWSGMRQPGEGDQAGANELLAWLDEPPALSDSLASSDALGSDEGALPPWLLEAATIRDGASSRGSEIQEN